MPALVAATFYIGVAMAVTWRISEYEEEGATTAGPGSDRELLEAVTAAITGIAGSESDRSELNDRGSEISFADDDGGAVKLKPYVSLASNDAVPTLDPAYCITTPRGSVVLH